MPSPATKKPRGRHHTLANLIAIHRLRGNVNYAYPKGSRWRVTPDLLTKVVAKGRLKSGEPVGSHWLSEAHPDIILAKTLARIQSQPGPGNIHDSLISDLVEQFKAARDKPHRPHSAKR